MLLLLAIPTPLTATTLTLGLVPKRLISALCTSTFTRSSNARVCPWGSPCCDPITLCLLHRTHASCARGSPLPPRHSQPPRQREQVHEGTNYIRDPTRPRLCDLLTPAEVEAYVNVQSSARAACVASEIKGIAQLLAQNVEYSFLYYSKVSQCLQMSLDAQETLYRIVTTPVPYPYAWILNVMLVVFIYSVPFLYDSQRGGSYFGIIILVLAYFGCQRIAEQCENPLEWDACDLDVEALTMWLHDETRDISNFTHSQSKCFIPSNIRYAPAAPTAPAPGLVPLASRSPKADASSPIRPASPKAEASGSPKAAAAAGPSSVSAKEREQAGLKHVGAGSAATGAASMLMGWGREYRRNEKRSRRVDLDCRNEIGEEEKM